MHVAKRKGMGLSTRGRPPLPVKGMKASKGPASNYRRYAIAIIALLSILFGMLWFQAEDPTHQQVLISREPPMPVDCTPRPVVCAHGIPGSDLNARTGSMDLLSETWKSGITCLGLSVTPLKDSLVAREAERIQRVTDSLRAARSLDEQLLPLTPTHEEVLQWANNKGLLATEDFPTLERALKWFHETLVRVGEIRHSETRPLKRWFGQSDKTSPLDTNSPLLLLIIEGDNVKTSHYSTAARAVASFGLSHHVGIIVPEGAAHRDAFAGAIAKASPEIYRGLSVTSDAGKDAQGSRKLGSTLFDFLAPDAESPDAMLAAARAPGIWKPSVAVGVSSEAAFNSSIQYNFPVIMTSHALHFHKATQSRADACRRSEAEAAGGHMSGHLASVASHRAAEEQLMQSGVISGGHFSSVSATTTTTRTSAMSVFIGEQTGDESSVVGAGDGRVGAEDESAEAGGVGDHDLEQKAAAIIRLERVAARAAAAVAAVAANATSTPAATLMAISFDGSTTHETDALHAEQSSLNAHGSSNTVALHSDDQTLESVSKTAGNATPDLNSEEVTSAGNTDTAQSRRVTLPEDEQPQFEVEGQVVKNATHELAPADEKGGSDPALEAQAGTAAPVLRARIQQQHST